MARLMERAVDEKDVNTNTQRNVYGGTRYIFGRQTTLEQNLAHAFGTSLEPSALSTDHERSVTGAAPEQGPLPCTRTGAAARSRSAQWKTRLEIRLSTEPPISASKPASPKAGTKSSIIRLNKSCRTRINPCRCAHLTTFKPTT